MCVYVQDPVEMLKKLIAVKKEKKKLIAEKTEMETFYTEVVASLKGQLKHVTCETCLSCPFKLATTSVPRACYDRMRSPVFGQKCVCVYVCVSMRVCVCVYVCVCMLVSVCLFEYVST